MQVKRIERLSDQYLVHLGLAGTEQHLIASVPPRQTVEFGQTLQLEVRQSLWFDTAGQRIYS